jgi:outer membrane protein assembly factor BamB
VAGLGTPTESIDLGGGTTQYTAEGFGSLWLPIVQGSVMRVDAATGQVQGRVEIGDPTPVELHADPHAVAADADGIWVTSVAEHALVFIDPATMTLGRRIPLDVEPYALAIDGRRAWVTSFQGDVLVSVDLDSGKVVSTTTVPKPTGVAVGAGRAWVVAHRANQVYAVNTKTAKVNVIVELGLPSPNGVCGACVENIVFAAGALWTANNEGRSVTRIDPHGAAVPERIELPLRVWAVAAGGGRVWAGQFDPASATEGWQVAAIDPRSNEVTTYPLPAQSVAWAGDALWTIVPAGRTDILTRVDIGG